MRGFNVLHPMGWDAFGQPAETEAINKKRHPRPMVAEYIGNYKRQLRIGGFCYDWERELNSSSPEYYRWTQWLFLLLYKRGLAYRTEAPVNWCPKRRPGAGQRGSEGRPLLALQQPRSRRRTWCSGSSASPPTPIAWPMTSTPSTGPSRSSPCSATGLAAARAPSSTCRSRATPASKMRVFTTRPDTVFGMTFCVLAPEHPLVSQITTPEQKAAVEAYVEQDAQRDRDRAPVDREGARRRLHRRLRHQPAERRRMCRSTSPTTC